MREKRRLKLITPSGKVPAASTLSLNEAGKPGLCLGFGFYGSDTSSSPHELQLIRMPLSLFGAFLWRPSNKGKVLCGTTGRTQSRHRPPHGLPAWPEQGAPAGPHTCSTYGPSFPTWPQPEQGQPMSAFSVCCYCCNVFINP